MKLLLIPRFKTLLFFLLAFLLVTSCNTESVVDNTPDNTPDDFSFVALTNQAISEVVTSMSVIITGIKGDVNIAVHSSDDVKFKINSGAYITSETVNNGDTITLQTTTPSAYGTQKDVSITIGTLTKTWSVSTSTLSTKNYQGTFVAAAHPTSGGVEISVDKKSLLFKQVTIDDGPLLEVWLSKTQVPEYNTSDNYISIGDLQGTQNKGGNKITGDYTYDISNFSSTDFDSFKYVVIWCVEFNVSFGYAELSNQ